MKKHVHGQFCWNELGTTDPIRAKSFYGEMFGWKWEDVPMGDGQTYTLFKLGNTEVTGCYTLNAEQTKMGVPPHWLPYVWTNDVDTATAKAEKLGGKVLMPAMSIMNNMMRLSVVSDSTGATIGLMRDNTKDQVTEHANPIGTVCWNELLTRDAAEAHRFYGDLLEWRAGKMEGAPASTSDMPGYTVFRAPGLDMVGGMMTMVGDAFKDVPPNWMMYVAVADCDERAKAVTRLGGKVLMPPTDIPGVGRFASIVDPTGAHLAIIKLNG